MKKLTSFAVNYPVTVLMAIMGILLLGVILVPEIGDRFVSGPHISKGFC